MKKDFINFIIERELLLLNKNKFFASYESDSFNNFKKSIQSKIRLNLTLPKIFNLILTDGSVIMSYIAIKQLILKSTSLYILPTNNLFHFSVSKNDLVSIRKDIKI